MQVRYVLVAAAVGNEAVATLLKLKLVYQAVYGLEEIGKEVGVGVAQGTHVA